MSQSILAGDLSLPDLDLPAYDNLPPPCYATNLRLGESRVDQTPSMPVHLSSLVRNRGGFKLHLHGQESGSDMPVYGHNSLIEGTVGLSRTFNVSEVYIKIEGKLNVTGTEIGAELVETIQKTYSIWKYDSSLKTGPPNSMPFSFRLPTHFQYRSKKYPLPPTMEANFHPGLIVRSVYTLTLVALRGRHLGGLWISEAKTGLRFNYEPRTSPPQGINPDLDFSEVERSGVSMLSNWHQESSVLKPPNGPPGPPISVKFLVPAVRTFGISDVIPFHILLQGTISCLRDFLPAFSAGQAASSKQLLAVSLLRQISAEIRGAKKSRNIVIGEATLLEMPALQSRTKEEDVILRWAGEILCKDMETYPGFVAGPVGVRDFLILVLRPSTLAKISFQLPIPIQLVTDTWTDHGIAA